MICVSSLYPKQADTRFDWEYYRTQHMPRSIAWLSAAPGFRAVSVERGVDVEFPPIPALYVAMCHYYFDSLEAFLAAFQPHADALQADIANYTNVRPIIHITDVLIQS